jgi:hypothetical protein
MQNIFISSFFVDYLPFTTSTYSSTLTANSTFFTRFNGTRGSLYYYQAIQMNFSTNGVYRISSNSTMNTIGYIYNNSFDLWSPGSNLLAWNDDGAHNSQFEIQLNFNGTSKYILVFTTLNCNTRSWRSCFFSIVTTRYVMNKYKSVFTHSNMTLLCNLIINLN